jgi:hypothetical protein
MIIAEPEDPGPPSNETRVQAKYIDQRMSNHRPRRHATPAVRGGGGGREHLKIAGGALRGEIVARVPDIPVGLALLERHPQP